MLLQIPQKGTPLNGFTQALVNSQLPQLGISCVIRGLLISTSTCSGTPFMSLGNPSSCGWQPSQGFVPRTACIGQIWRTGIVSSATWTRRTIITCFFSADIPSRSGRQFNYAPTLHGRT
ncbi:hypothetical protein OIU85_023211 [Salix viminalis]|uniref:Uncharacterized protein n=1 Tax=Salix viminalis TaxID=40686 RepID=A0A9Q0NI85_SALVM|nr:hypothetical protein OIU85_023211 [Salix viminalis]